MTEQEAWNASSGVWKLHAEKAGRQRIALIVGEGRVRAVGEISGITAHGDRVALDGVPLPPGHPIRDRYLDTPDPVINGSQNPVGYYELTARPTTSCARARVAVVRPATATSVPATTSAPSRPGSVPTLTAHP